MCCRYWTDESPEIREIVEEMNKSPLVSKWQRATGITAYGEIKPTNVVPVIATDKSGQKKVYPMKWGFTCPDAAVERPSGDRTGQSDVQRSMGVSPLHCSGNLLL